jgi:glycosyltransferase involved in cell wall biosynthesis
MLTKNEADVVRRSLTEAAKWADYVYVYDGHSTDGTWEIINSIKNPRIIPWRQHRKPFRDGLRAEPFEAFRRQAAPGDWWLRFDADEFYPVSPREVLARVPSGHDFVWGVYVEYFLTDKDVAELDFSRGFDEIRPRLRHYKVVYSEPRAFRYRPRLVWDPARPWPTHPGVVARERIVFQHYPCRSPQQIQTRLDVRKTARAQGFKGWDHASQLAWQEKVVPQSECRVDDDLRPFQIDERALPRHIEPFRHRLVKTLMHRTGIWP